MDLKFQINYNLNFVGKKLFWINLEFENTLKIYFYRFLI